MCGGVQFTHDGKLQRVYFPSPKAALPVRRKDGEHELITWGRRREEQGVLPPGGWARHDSIRAGKWQRWHPVPVKIDVEQFMEKDHDGVSHWFDLAEGESIQGLLAQYDDERRLYVVTVTPESPVLAAIHDRWPRVLQA